MYGAIAPKSALLSDSNAELINCYRVVHKHPKIIAARVKSLQALHSEAFYYKTRDERPTCEIEKAVRFIYLNRSCFNGIYRVNRKGDFNVPKGTKETIDFSFDDFHAVSRILNAADIESIDFEKAIDQAAASDLIFCDPPYTVSHNNNGFVRYNETMFSWADQIRLRNAVVRAAERGAYILITNAAHRSIRDLYADTSFVCRGIGRKSVVGGGNDYRGEYAEFLISNYRLALFDDESPTRPTQEALPFS